jgi:hypothetical protein
VLAKEKTVEALGSVQLHCGDLKLGLGGGVAIATG